MSFEQGDVNHAYSVGFLWNGVDKPPESDPKNRVILTPGGHTLRFEDGDNKKIILQSSSGHKITLDDSSSSPTLKLQTKGDQSVTLDDQAKTITLQTKGSQSVTLDDQASSITMQGGGRILKMSNGMVQIS